MDKFNKSNKLDKINIPGKYYLVGGALRDLILNVFAPRSDKDWVIVGASVSQMQASFNGKKFKQVGKDFPVFLHPYTKDEYALARVERKVSAGHTGFSCEYGVDVTLEDDLLRRDFTINAMAISPEYLQKDKDGNLQITDHSKIIDPYGALDDIKHKKLRHVSNAFIEDPLRVLRAYRFLARFASLGFTIHPDTLGLIKKIIASNGLSELSRDRIWQEVRKALQEVSPGVFFSGLQDAGVIDFVFNNAADIKSKSAFNKLDQFAQLLCDSDNVLLVDRVNIVFSLAVCLYFGADKFSNKQDYAKVLNLPIPRLLNNMLNKMFVGFNGYKKLVNLFNKISSQVGHGPQGAKNELELFAGDILNFLNKLDYWRSKERFNNILLNLSYVMKLEHEDLYLEAERFNSFLINLLNLFAKQWKLVNLDQVKDSNLNIKNPGKFVMTKKLEVLDKVLPDLLNQAHLD